MLAVIEMGGKQYRVSPDQIFYVEKTGNEVGAEFDVPRVLFLENESSVSVGTPILENVKVTAKVIDNVKAPKILGFKYKRRKNYRRKWGHRQSMQKIQITAIKA